MFSKSKSPGVGLPTALPEPRSQPSTRFAKPFTTRAAVVLSQEFLRPLTENKQKLQSAELNQIASISKSLSSATRTKPSMSDVIDFRVEAIKAATEVSLSHTLFKDLEKMGISQQNIRDFMKNRVLPTHDDFNAHAEAMNNLNFNQGRSNSLASADSGTTVNQPVPSVQRNLFGAFEGAEGSLPQRVAAEEAAISQVLSPIAHFASPGAAPSNMTAAEEDMVLAQVPDDAMDILNQTIDEVAEAMAGDASSPTPQQVHQMDTIMENTAEELGLDRSVGYTFVRAHLRRQAKGAGLFSPDSRSRKRAIEHGRIGKGLRENQLAAKRAASVPAMRFREMEKAAASEETLLEEVTLAPGKLKRPAKGSQEAKDIMKRVREVKAAKVSSEAYKAKHPNPFGQGK